MGDDQFLSMVGGKISVKYVFYCERHMVRNVSQNERSNIAINPSAMDAKRPVIYHAPVGLTVCLQRSTSAQWLHTRWGPSFVWATTRGSSLYSKNDHPSDFERRVTDAMCVFVMDAVISYQWPTSAASRYLQWKPQTHCRGSGFPTECDHGGWKLGHYHDPLKCESEHWKRSDEQKLW